MLIDRLAIMSHAKYLPSFTLLFKVHVKICSSPNEGKSQVSYERKVALMISQTFLSDAEKKNNNSGEPICIFEKEGPF